MGPNGAGKSLLLRLMHGLVAPTTGMILWAGTPMSASDPAAAGHGFPKTGAAPTNRDRQYHLCALACAACRASERRSRALQALQLAGLERHALAPARVLSGGEQQRLCLARALSLDPDVLFLDEPTASLDPASTLAIERLLLDAKRRGTKVIVVTHDVGQARRLAEDVIFLHHGQLIEYQPASRFFEQPESVAGRAFIAGDLVLSLGELMACMFGSAAWPNPTLGGLALLAPLHGFLGRGQISSSSSRRPPPRTRDCSSTSCRSSPRRPVSRFAWSRSAPARP